MQSWIPNPRYTQAGVQRAVIAPWVEGLRPIRGNPDDQRLTTDIQPPVTAWYTIGCSPAAQVTQATATSKNGSTYAVRAVFPFQQGLLAGQLYALYQLIDQPVILLFQDLRGNWWLAGLRRGLNPSIKADTGVLGGEQLETLQLDGLEPEPWRYVPATIAQAWYAAAEPIPTDAATTGDVYDPADIGGDDL